MEIEIKEEVRKAFRDEDTLKILGSIDKEGNPHVTFKGTLDLNEDGDLEFLEIVETSQTNKNLVHSIWFKRKVAVNLLTKDRRSYQIKGYPKKMIISGREFSKRYSELREKLGDVDLSAIWVIEPTEIKEETFEKRREEEEREHPLLVHLDRLLV